VRGPGIEKAQKGLQALIIGASQEFPMRVDKRLALSLRSFAFTGGDAERIGRLVPQEVWSDAGSSLRRLWNEHQSGGFPFALGLAQVDRRPRRRAVCVQRDEKADLL